MHSLVVAAHGQRIAARFCQPRGKARGSVLIVPAMGVTQEFYRPFASWLAEQGYVAATFDYRGTGATGSGYWRENTRRIRPLAWWLWFVIAPPALALLGYFPGRMLRKVGDLPKGVMAQWRRWCLDPEYAVGAEGDAVRAEYAAVRLPIVSLSFSDDEMMSARNVESIHGFYANAPRKMKRIAPRDIGVRRIGHFGFFRAAFERSLWRPHLLPELA
jgi:predicted alpha/beta hydrolase